MTRFFSDSVGQNETNVQVGVRRNSHIGGNKESTPHPNPHNRPRGFVQENPFHEGSR
jgi:hypothetical protein